MTLYRGKLSAQAIERGFPHSVEILIPLGGLGKTLDDMYDFHVQYGIRAHTRSRRSEDGRDYTRWYFADSAVAKSFVTNFSEID